MKTQDAFCDMDATSKSIIAMILACIFLTFYANTLYPKYLARVPHVGRGERAREFAARKHKSGELARLNSMVERIEKEKTTSRGRQLRTSDQNDHGL
jgi:hypothetical protein